jgi:hypothetical protein
MNVHQNALDYVPRKVDNDCLQELRWFYDRRDLSEARRDIAQWQAKYPRLCNWVEDNIEETLTYYRPPLPHHKHMKSTDEIDKPLRRDLLCSNGTGDRAAKSRDRGCKPGRAAFSLAPCRTIWLRRATSRRHRSCRS